eukprot:Hpha_TRINITY_DN15316_c6_g5::TRINITY_DN15316_c6_g5_i1::g.89996::m.89996/K10396/KIF5; kinesin family member 5
MSERVQVYIRFRPQNEKEQERDGKLAVRFCNEQEVDVLPNLGQTQRTFTFDHIFNSSAVQEDIYDKIGVPVVESVLQGYNGTILAYGQTGSGKTHTMMGPEGGTSAALEEDSVHYEKRGLVPRIISQILSRLESQPSAEVEWHVSVSCFELYKEKIRDLIRDPAESQSAEHQDLKIREDRGQTGRGVYVENLREVRCQSPAEIFDVVRMGMRNKQVASTGMNDTSSRSHTLITLWVTQISHVQDDTKTVGRLNLVDLAGSERIEKTGAEGDRLKEAQTINLSLTLLGNVIMKLTDGRSLHIPYRDSKLTRILQDSFGGNSRTTLLCNCSPSSLHQSETVSTLGFANRAKQIKNKPRVNKEMGVQELQMAYERAQEEIRLLKDRIVVLEGPRPTGSAPSKGERPSTAGDALLAQDDSEIEGLRSEIRSLMRELAETKEELFDKVEEGKRMQERANFYEKRASEATQKFNEMKAKSEREKMAADSWMRKYNELQKEMEQKAKAAPRAKSQPRKTSVSGGSTLSKKTSSVKPKVPSKAGSTPSNTPVTPASPLMEGTVTSMPEGQGQGVLEDALEEARTGEAQALMRERDLQEMLEAANQRVAVALAAAEAAEKKHQEGAAVAQRLNSELERTSAEYEEMLQRQDKEIAELQGEVESARMGEVEGGVGSGGGGSAELNKRLEAENALLYEQNRENANRIVELTKAKDLLERAFKQAQDKEAKLMREIELANISADIKHRLLGSKLRATKAAFQQRLLDCFSADSPG